MRRTIAVAQAALKGGDVSLSGRFHQVPESSLSRRPTGSDLSIWIGGAAVPGTKVLTRTATLADGWFVLCGAQRFPHLRSEIESLMNQHGRDPAAMGKEASVRTAGRESSHGPDAVPQWQPFGISHFLRTLGASLAPHQQLETLRKAVQDVPIPDAD